MPKHETGQQQQRVERQHGEREQHDSSTTRWGHGWLGLVLLLAAACTQSRPTREEKKPRAQIVVLATSGTPSDEAQQARLDAALEWEGRRCVKPACELMLLATGGAAGAKGFDAVLTPSSAPGTVATNVEGGQQQVIVKRALGDFEIFGWRAGAEGEQRTERMMPPVVEARMRKGATVLVLTDECVGHLEDVITRHGTWWGFLFAAFGRACEGQPAKAKHVLSTVVAATPELGEGYVRLQLEFDRNTKALLLANTSYETWIASAQ